MHSHPFPGLQIAPVFQPTPGRCDTAAHASGCRKADALRQTHKIVVSRTDVHPLRKRPPLREADDRLFITNSRLLAFAIAAMAAAKNERRGDPVSFCERPAIGPDFFNDTGQFVAHNMRQLDVRI